MGGGRELKRKKTNAMLLRRIPNWLPIVVEGVLRANTTLKNHATVPACNRCLGLSDLAKILPAGFLAAFRSAPYIWRSIV